MPSTNTPDGDSDKPTFFKSILKNMGSGTNWSNRLYPCTMEKWKEVIVKTMSAFMLQTRFIPVQTSALNSNAITATITKTFLRVRLAGGHPNRY